MFERAKPDGGGVVRSASVCKPHESERGGNAGQSCDTDRVARGVHRSAGSAMASLEPGAAMTRYTASSQLASVPINDPSRDRWSVGRRPR